ncbi:Hypothetical protein GLP15_4226 [Giardia lamblia P15]|uniref:Uncharacterized protein n=1 Tax=Giardia intestinalis (strain P15) TaxID=658858 RepID=E1F380_GIAIA|nr:Hypothetical protein GLP15_4226 [Giardia lamblia P15]
MRCLLQKRKHICSQPLPEGVSYADYVSVVSQLPPPEIEEQICHWDIATLADSDFIIEYSPEQYPLLSVTRGDVQLVLNVAGQGAFSTSCITTVTEFSAHLLEVLTVRGYEPEYEIKLLQSDNLTKN